MADPSPPSPGYVDIKEVPQDASEVPHARRDSINKHLIFIHEDMMDVKEDHHHRVPTAFPGVVPSTAEGYSIYSNFKDGKVIVDH